MLEYDIVDDGINRLMNIIVISLELETNKLQIITTSLFHDHLLSFR